MAVPFLPTIKPWLPKLWRDPNTLQIGADTTVGVQVCGVDAATASWLASLDGSRSEEQILAEAAAIGLELATAARILSGLRRADVLLSAPMCADEIADLGPLLPELVDLCRTVPKPGHGRRTLAARDQRHIVIDGANRIGVPLGALLAASGVGRLSFLDSEPVRRCDAAVGGFNLADEGEPRIIAAERAIRRISPNPGTHSDAGQPEPDLIVLCRPWTAHDPLQAHGMAHEAPHLVVAVHEGRVVIGPLVLPGQTSCLHCAELHRTDRDPGWPAVAAHLLASGRRAMHEPTSMLATLAAALAAGQVLDHLDGTRVPEVIEATLELSPPDWRLHRRRWPPHADCGCLAAARDSDQAG